MDAENLVLSVWRRGEHSNKKSQGMTEGAFAELARTIKDAFQLISGSSTLICRHLSPSLTSAGARQKSVFDCVCNSNRPDNLERWMRLRGCRLGAQS